MFLINIFIGVLAALRERRLKLTALAVAGASIALIQIVEAVLFGQVINALIEGDAVLPKLSIWAGLGAVGIGLGVSVALIADRIAHRNKLKLLRDGFEGALLRSEVSASAVEGAGATIRNILIGSDACFAVWLGFFRELLPALMAMLILFPVAVAISPSLTLVLAVFALLFVCANLLILNKTQAGQRAVDAEHRGLSSRISDVLNNAGVVRAFTRLHQEVQAVEDISELILIKQYPVLTWWALLNVFTRAASTIAIVMVLLFGALLVNREALSIGEVVTFAGFAGVLVTRLEQATGSVTRLYPSAPVIDTLLALAKETRQAEHGQPECDLAAKEGRVDFHGVSFRFPGTSTGVHDVRLSVPAGTSVAIVGSTGSGKSTLLALLQKIFEPETGRVEIDGQDLNGVNQRSVRRAMAVVAQDGGLFDRSVADNLRVARPSASEADLWNALEAAQVDEVFRRHDAALGFRLGEKGARLSGGERQRVAIARALLKDAPILILDEATSALDTVTEAKVQRAIERAAFDRTTFIIAHRLSTIRNVDEIIVLDHGRVVERGSFETLKARDGHFQQLLKAGQAERTAQVNRELGKLQKFWAQSAN